MMHVAFAKLFEALGAFADDTNGSAHITLQTDPASLIPYGKSFGPWSLVHLSG